jgi:hypothetical protein
MSNVFRKKTITFPPNNSKTVLYPIYSLGMEVDMMEVASVIPKNYFIHSVICCYRSGDVTAMMMSWFKCSERMLVVAGSGYGDSSLMQDMIFFNNQN